MGRFSAMASPCEVLMELEDEDSARNLLSAIAACAWRIERKYSRYRDDNIIAQINSSDGRAIRVDDETASLLDFADHVHRLSSGMFDITSGVLRKAWTFDGGEQTPARRELDSLLPLVGWEKVQWQRPEITLRPGMQIDFGGIGKEYAVDQAILIAASQVDAPVLINFGGDLAVTGSRRGDRPWRVGIEGITGEPHNAVKLIELSAGALATSGDTYRFVESKGVRLPHILDPHDGRPVRNAPRSITVAAPNCTQAGMFCTLAMLQGPIAESFLQTEGVRHWIQR